MSKGLQQESHAQEEWRRALSFLLQTRMVRGAEPQAAISRATYLSLNSRRRSYDSFPEILLPEPASESLGSEPFPSVVRRRSSRRSFAEHPLPLETLSALLHLSGAVNRRNPDGFTFRPWPSAGGLFPLDIFLCIRNVAGISAGIYWYCPFSHSLRHLREAAALPTVDGALLGGSPWSSQAHLTCLLAADLDKTIGKYEARGLRYVFLDAGHLGHALSLAAESLGLASCAIGGFFEDELNQCLGLGGVDESVVYALTVGAAAESSASELPSH